jgi:hypothetical protein
MDSKQMRIIQAAWYDHQQNISGRYQLAIHNWAGCRVWSVDATGMQSRIRIRAAGSTVRVPFETKGVVSPNESRESASVEDINALHIVSMQRS